MSEASLLALQIVLTVVSMAGAAFSWWKANASSKARSQAEAAERRAKDLVSVSQLAAHSTDAIARTVEGPALELQRSRGDQWLLVSNRDDPITVVELINAAEFNQQIAEFRLPFTIQPRSQYRFALLTRGVRPLPHELHLRLSDQRELHVRIP